MKIHKLLLCALAFAASSVVAVGQSYDDDIYYDASKAKKQKNEAKARAKAERDAALNYPAADTYAGQLTSSSRDIDEYNRRGIFAIPSDSLAAAAANDTTSGDAFAFSRRIERFYNPEVIVENPDGSVTEYYYAGKDEPEINIYVNGGSYWGYPSAALYYDPWYFGPATYNPWYYGGFYNPWSWGWGPSWSWSWGWGPAWSWGPSWGWGWGAGWYPGPSWGWGGGPGYHRPASTRPERPHGGNYAGSYRNAAAAASGGRYNGSSASSRPASSGSNWNINNVGQTTTRPAGGSAYRPGATGGRGGANASGTATGRRPSGISSGSSSARRGTSTSTNRSTNRSSGTSTRSNTNSSSRSNSGSSYRSSGGGSYRSSGSGGGFRSGGGGGSRGGGGRR